MAKSTHAADPEDERNWAMVCHLSGYSGFLIPFGNILIPLFIYIIMKDEFPLVMDQAREVMNFQISMTIYLLIAAVLCIILIGIPFLIVLVVAALVLPALGAIKSRKGLKYRYPLTMRFF